MFFLRNAECAVRKYGMNSKCVTATQILRLLAYSAVESVRLCVPAHSVICARVVCLRVFGLSLSLSSSSSSAGVRELRSPDRTFLLRLQNLKAALFSSRKVRESHASICFFLIFFRVFFLRAPCSSSFFCFFCPVSVRHSLFLEDPVKRKKCGDDAVRARSYLVYCRLLAWRDYSV